MIVVTDEMRKKLAVFHAVELTEESIADIVKDIAELHEANSTPTQEPLSDHDIWRIWDEGDNVSSGLDFARAVEQAHGIGVTK